MTAPQVGNSVEAGAAALWALDHEDPWPGSDSFSDENLRYYMTASAAVLAAAAPEIHRLRSEAESVYLYLIHGVLRRLDTTGPKPAEDVMGLCEQIGALVTGNAARAEVLQAERDRLREAIRSGCDGDYTPQRGKIFRADGKHTKHDQCVHGAFIYAGCEECLCDFLRAALGEAGDG